MGSQIGRLVVIDVVDEEQKVHQSIFHAKTHRNGAIITEYSIHFTRATRFDPKELFVYSLLYLLGLGPEAEFFGIDEKDFYICTENVEK